MWIYVYVDNGTKMQSELQTNKYKTEGASEYGSDIVDLVYTGGYHEVGTNWGNTSAFCCA
jgi:hypothetical protein